MKCVSACQYDALSVVGSPCPWMRFWTKWREGPAVL
ncbi:MAG: hypothetical protein R2860_10455 [Desulfobacterales bacterium]